MRTITISPPIETAQVTAVDPNLQLFIEREQVKREIDSLMAKKDLLDEQIKERLSDGERISNGVMECYLCPVPRPSFDYKRLMADKVVPDEVANRYLATSTSYQLRTRKVEGVTVDPSTPEGAALRDRLAATAKGLTG